MAGRSEQCQEVCHVRMVISEPQMEERGYSAWKREVVGLGASFQEVMLSVFQYLPSYYEGGSGL